ncbi:LytTR family transcriptional regulator DNA-binding domain-containing protein [Hoeflea sp. G2-23]|uniref:LytTR family transcriptional regulator DNA-binding domain-containing protein n=1 Tax=Hoeflea algicola TaxID=2983763 RepID=A0ABT3ZGL2_9HYPH|nr:MHYT domain-containing protein [Hoeflea algicola]MCY0150394.1 LytTR family transcriptional regulator DNA-binding domain-containing protein [Hoeflea algicola]
MASHHNLYLVALSIIVAIQASYVGLYLALRISGAFALNRRLLIAASAMTLAVGIWGMHFIGMLSMAMAAEVDYLVLPTLLSFLVCVLVTGIAVYLASLRSPRLLAIAAGVMGLGITTMHYVGMIALHSSARLSYDPVYVIISFIIAVTASGLGLWLAFSADRRPPLFLCATALGCAVSGMHYTAMAGTTFDFSLAAPITSTSYISSDTLAVIVSVVAFAVSGIFMLTLVPKRVTSGPHQADRTNGADGADDFYDSGFDDSTVADPAVAEVTAVQRSSSGNLLPIEKNGNRFHIAASDVISVHANAHYTYVFNGRDDLFCSLSISEIFERLPKPLFYRTHRSYIVSLAHVGQVKKSGDAAIAELVSPVRRTVPISRARVADLRQKLAAHQSREHSNIS